MQYRISEIDPFKNYGFTDMERSPYKNMDSPDAVVAALYKIFNGIEGMEFKPTIFGLQGPTPHQGIEIIIDRSTVPSSIDQFSVHFALLDLVLNGDRYTKPS